MALLGIDIGTSGTKTLLVSERGFGKVRRTFGIKVPVNADAIAADYEQGLLSVTLPKRAEAKPRKIDVKVKRRNLDVRHREGYWARRPGH